MIGAFRSSRCSIVLASSCALSDPLLYRFPVLVFFDRGHPCFRNFNSTIPVDVVRVKSYVDSFLDPTCVPVRSTISKLDLVPNRIVACLVGVFSANSVGIQLQVSSNKKLEKLVITNILPDKWSPGEPITVENFVIDTPDRLTSPTIYSRALKWWVTPTWAISERPLPGCCAQFLQLF